MNNVAYAFLHNLFFFFGFCYYLKYGDAFIGFGIIAVGIMVCYFLDDFLKVIKIII